jgi:hypothetical protein
LRGGEGLFLNQLPDPQIGIKRKHPKGKDDEQEINTHQLGTQLSAGQPPQKFIPHRHASSGILWGKVPSLW